MKDQTQQQVAQDPRRPTSPIEDAMVVGKAPDFSQSHGAKGGSNRSAAGSQNGTVEQNHLGMIERWKRQVKLLRSETFALYLAYRDPRVPWYSKAFAALVVGYAFSPIDLIPDFVPILGYLDDLILVPIGVTIALKMIPDKVMEECRLNAREALGDGRPTNWAAVIVIVGIWLLVVAIFIWLVVRIIRAS